MPRHRPFSVMLLAFIAGLAAVLCLACGLQLVGRIPSGLGAVRFFDLAPLGAAAWVAAAAWVGAALLSVWGARLLWRVDARGWLLMSLVATSLLLLGMLSIIGGSDAAAMLPAILLGGVALLLLAFPGVREAFRDTGWAG